LLTVIMSFTDVKDMLEPYLFQVIGSTPVSLKENLKKVTLKGKAKEGSQLVTISIFAAAVNKSTLESFLAKPEFADIRPTINAAISIQGKANMTAFTLLGHCIMTSDKIDDIPFVAAFRRKMGQNHLWSGTLDSGSLSEKQRNILKEKKKNVDSTEAMLLGQGFLKWVNLDTSRMTAEESAFWGDTTSDKTASERTVAGPSKAVAPVAARPSASEVRSPPRPIAIPRAPTASASRQITPPKARAPAIGTTTLTTEGEAESFDLPDDVVDYRRNVMNMNDNDIIDSVRRNGLDNFILKTRDAIVRDPEGKGGATFSTVGR
jgi:hypothetical protein